MSLNKLALIRYQRIDKCLQNRYRKWSLEDLIEQVSDAIYEYEGIRTGVSRRTVQADIQLMRSDKLGYNAPIVVRERKYYSYEDPDFSIHKTPIKGADVDKMKEIIGVLKQLNGFSYFDDMSEMITKLESQLKSSTEQGPDLVQFEKNRLLKGIELLGPLYQAAAAQQSLLLEYKSFKAREASQKIVYPYLLKEYRNRWFLICRSKKGKHLDTLALDRMVSVQTLPEEPFQAYQGVGFERYYSDALGVTKNERERARRVILRLSEQVAPYVLTKPIHDSQQVLKADATETIIRLDLVLNFELEREILGFGEDMEVLAPQSLRDRIARRVRKMQVHYTKDHSNIPDGV